MNDREQAKKGIIEHLAEIENDNVLRSIILVMGDYAVSESKEERANYITATLFSIANCEKIENLSKIYTVAHTLSKFEAERTI